MYFTHRMSCGPLSFMAVLLTSLIGSVVHPAEQVGVPPEIVADYIHALVEADRMLYTDARGGAHAGTWSHRGVGALEGTGYVTAPGSNAHDDGMGSGGAGDRASHSTHQSVANQQREWPGG